MLAFWHVCSLCEWHVDTTPDSQWSVLLVKTTMCVFCVSVNQWWPSCMSQLQLLYLHFFLRSDQSTL